MFRSKSLFLLLGLLLFSGICLADIIHFKDGRKIEGVIVSEDAKKVKLKTKYGTKEFLLSEIDKIEKKKTRDQEYKERLASLNKEDIDSVFELVAWCKANKLDSKAKVHLKEIIKLDPNNAKARSELGYQRFEGKWYTPRELKAIKAKQDREEKLAQGLVEYKGQWLPAEDVEKIKEGYIKYKGKWVTPLEKERLEQNLVLYEGQWVPAEDAEKMKEGLYKVKGQWVNKIKADIAHSDWEDPWVLKSEHLCLKTNKNYDYAQNMLAEGEDAYKQIRKIVEVEPSLSDTRLTIYMASTIEEYNQIGNEIGDEKSSAYSVFFAYETPEDGPVSVCYSIGDKESDVTFTKGLLRHALVEQYLRRIDEKAEIPDWYIKGQAAKIERFFHRKYIIWSLKALRRVGGFMKTSQFFDAFGFTEQEIFQSGLICAYLESKDVSDKVKEAYDNALAAIKARKKVGSSFVDLEKALVKDEKNIRAFMGKH